MKVIKNKHNRAIEKIKKVFTKNFPFNLVHLGLLIVVLLIATTSFRDKDYTLYIPIKNTFATIVWGVSITLAIISYLILNKKIKLEYLYLSLIIPLGIMYCIVNPLGKVPDEYQHARKSYMISKGVFLADTDEEGYPIGSFNENFSEIINKDTSSYEEYWNKLTIPETDEETELNYSMATYAPICHMPQALGMLIARIFGGNIVVQCYAGRIVNMAVAILLMFFAIKVIPFKKHIVLFLGLLPITILEFASLSSDALTIGICIFFISYVLYLKYDDKKEKINKKDIAVLFISSIVVALSKIVYVPICLLLFILPKEKFNSKKNKYCIVTIIAGIAILLNLVWLMIASGYLNEVNPGVDSAEQVKYILTHPISYCLILFRTIIVYFQTFIMCLCGEGLGCYNCQASPIFVYSCLIMYAILFLVNDDEDRKPFDIKTKLSFGTIFVIIVLLIYTSLYVAWVKVRKALIYGVQARYFLPVILLTAIVLDNKLLTFNKKDKKNENMISNFKNKYLPSFMLFINLNALACQLFTYMYDFIISYYVK